LNTFSFVTTIVIRLVKSVSMIWIGIIGISIQVIILVLETILFSLKITRLSPLVAALISASQLI